MEGSTCRKLLVTKNGRDGWAFKILKLLDEEVERVLHKSNDCRICEPPILPTRWIYLLHTSNNVRCGGKLFVGNSGALHTGIALLNVLRTDVYPRPFEQGRKYDVQEFSISEEKGDNF